MMNMIAEAINKFIDNSFGGNREIKLLAPLLFIVTGAQTYFHDAFGYQCIIMKNSIVDDVMFHVSALLRHQGGVDGVGNMTFAQ